MDKNKKMKKSAQLEGIVKIFNYADLGNKQIVLLFETKLMDNIGCPDNTTHSCVSIDAIDTKRSQFRDFCAELGLTKYKAVQILSTRYS